MTFLHVAGFHKSWQAGADLRAQPFVNLTVQMSWQAQHFVNLAQISWQAQHFVVNLEVQISWQAQHFVNLRVQISWQAQHFVLSDAHSH